MQEIRCPHCGKMFQVDESGYAQILQQVRDREFEKELDRRQAELALKTESELRIARMEQESAHKNDLSAKDREIAEKDREIERLSAALSNADTEKNWLYPELYREKIRNFPKRKPKSQGSTGNSNCRKKKAD